MDTKHDSIQLLSAAPTLAGAGDCSEKELASLRKECAILREKLARIEPEYEFFRSEFYVNARTVREFEDVDIEQLQRESTGPVELI